jgi:hypothetical protein
MTQGIQVMIKLAMRVFIQPILFCVYDNKNGENTKNFVSG